MSIKDIIKNSFLEGFNNTAPSLKMMLLCLLVSLLLGFYIFFIYRLKCSETFYSKDFNVSLVMVSVITCAIILTIQSSVIVSLGMVGALSIVRFRTAVKNSVDLTFMFWAICVGIITGTGLIGLAAFVSFVLSVLLVLFNYIPSPSRNTYYVRIDAENAESIDPVLECIRGVDKRYSVQSQNISSDKLSMTVELSCDKPEDVMQSIYKCKGVKTVSVISHGDNTGS
ncbi:MAG: DUF4956 domain-containing protein [Lachnospiraceae bacterium]|nr:DUF4956 domain-containing protein [Lachnospiraceae bacterium]